MKKYRFIIYLCFVALLGTLPVRAQQEDDFDPILPPDPATAYKVSVGVDPAESATVSEGGTFAVGASVLIGCTPAEGYQFKYWTQDGVRCSEDTQFTYTVTPKNTTFVAHLTQIATHRLHLLTNPTGAATLVGAGDYYPNNVVNIGCTPNTDYHFLYWSLDGQIYSHEKECTYTMGAEDVTLTAFFTHTPHYTISISPDDTQAGEVSTSGGRYTNGEMVEISATAYADYVFSHWTLNGDYYTDQATFTYTVGDYDAAFVAVFDFDPHHPDDPATELTSTIRLVCEPDGAAELNLPTEDRYPEGDTLIIRATMNADYVFEGWYKDDEPVAPTTAFSYIVEKKDATFTLRARRIIHSRLELVSTPEEAVTFNFSSGRTYPAGTILPLRAAVAVGYVFDGWYEGDSLLSTTTELTYTIGTKDVILTAKALSAPDDDFDPLHPDDPAMKAVHIHAVSANKAMGKAYGSAICVEGKQVKIGAKATYGYNFARWSDGDEDAVRTVVAVQDTTYTAFFAPKVFNLTAMPADTMIGRVTGGGNYPYRTDVMLRAIPEDGYRFVRWSDYNTDIERKVRLTSDTLFTAYFEAIRYTVTVQSATPDMGQVSGGGIYAPNAIAVISATPKGSNRFLQWDDGNTDNPRKVQVKGNKTYIALFVGGHGTPTYIGEGADTSATYKILIGNQIYIVRNGVIYDTTGRRIGGTKN